MMLRAFIFLLALAAAGGAGWLTMQTGAESGRPATVELRAETAPTVDVLVAAAEIPGDAMLSPESLRWEAWPAVNVHESFITREERPEAMDDLAGTFANADLAGGEPIRDSRLTTADESLLSSRIGRGMRAAAVKVSAESAAGGFILPGDRVDVIRTVTGKDAPGTASRIIIANVRVLAIDQTDRQTSGEAVLGKTATLELSPSQAELIMAAEASGTLSLALRSVADHFVKTGSASDPVEKVLVRRGAERSTVTLR